MDWPLVAIHSLLMHTGKVLVMDGWEMPNPAKTFDPATNSFSTVNNAFGLDLFCSGHATLADGRVAVVGGHGSTELGIDDTSIFDPATNLWSAAAKMHSPRWYPTVTELGDGRLVAISGNITTSQWADTPEVYDPAANTWTELTNVDTSNVHENEYPLSYLLPSGNIFTIAPMTGESFLLDPGAQTWNLVDTSALLNGSAAMYRPGKILYSGGGTPLNSDNPSQSAAQVIDLTSGDPPTWQSTGAMNTARYTHTLTVLPNGKVLAVGGGATMNEGDTAHAELSSEEWDPDTGQWTSLAAMSVPRIYHSTSVLLPDGRVLVAGGGHEDNATSPGEYNAQYYSPPYLFKGARPTITWTPGSATYGSTATIKTPDAASIASVSLVSLGSDTHTLDMNQHFVPLQFTRRAGSLHVELPSAADASLAPPGYYMLFIVNADGVPSVAPMLQVRHGPSTPTVDVTSPSEGSQVSGSSITLAADASDPSGIGGVQLLVDGAPLGQQLTSPPYTWSWNSTTVPDGPHTISASAVNGAGVTGNSAPVSVTVSNPPAGGTGAIDPSTGTGNQPAGGSTPGARFTSPPAGAASRSGSATQVAGANGTFFGGITARCATPGGCAVTADASASVRAGAARTKTTRVKLGHTSKRLANGHRSAIKFRLSRRSIILLRRLAKMKVTVTVTVTARGHPPAVTTRTITLRAPRRKH